MDRTAARQRVVILHDSLSAHAPADAQDNLTQVREVQACLARLGYRVELLSFGREVEHPVSRLKAMAPAVVFNLVESLNGDASLIHVAAAVLDCLGLRYTGAGAAGHVCTGDKRIAKRLLMSAGLPTPKFAESAEALETWSEQVAGIVKPACEDASVAIDAGSVAHGRHALQRELRSRQARFGGEWFVEEYIDGRELNASLLWERDGLQVLPIAEIEFVDFPADRPRIVDYEAKWKVASFAYQNTPRRFVCGERDRVLLERVASIARQCHHMFALGGYSRVDFRVDERGEPLVLEVNANPCLSADAGFMAAALHAGIAADQVIARIVSASHSGLPTHTAGDARIAYEQPSARAARA